MNNINLLFNFLPFHWPEGSTRMYFHYEKHPKAYRLHRSQFPKHVQSLFPGVPITAHEFISTTFDQPEEGFAPLLIHLSTDHPCFAEQYFTHQAAAYFIKQSQLIVHTQTGEGIEVWVPAGKQPHEAIAVFESFQLRVQIDAIREQPVLIVTYDQQVQVLQKSILEITPVVSPTALTQIVTGRRLVRYADYVREADPDFYQAFPVLNQPLRDALGITAPTAKHNQYAAHYQYINQFYQQYLNTETFRAVIPIQNRYLEVPQESVRFIPHQPYDLQYTRICQQVEKDLLHQLRPCKVSPHPNPHLFFIAARQHEHLIETIKQYFSQGYGSFPGLNKLIHLNIFPQKELDIVFEDLENPLPEIIDALDAHANCWYGAVTYIAVFITPYGRQHCHLEKGIIECEVIQTLLERSITSQILEAELLEESHVKHEYHLTEIAFAILAKLDGIPWRLPMPVRHELTFGVGVFEGEADRVQYVCCACSYSNEGTFHSFEFFQKHEASILEGYINYSLRMYKELHQCPSRLVIHFYKRLHSKAMAPIEKVLARLHLTDPIPIFIISIKEQESKDILVFDTGWEELMPYSGTITRCATHQYLLFNNTRYVDGPFDSNEGFPFPLQLEIYCTEQKLAKDQEVIYELIGQVYQYSRMYWKTLGLQNLPVTVKYPELAAQLLPYFRDGNIPEFGKRNLWFL